MNRLRLRSKGGVAIVCLGAMVAASVSASPTGGARYRPRMNPAPSIPQEDVLVYTGDVLDFGAKAGDAVFDNTAAFQTAIDEANSNGGGIVYVPAGIYHFAGTLTLKSGVSLRGEWRDPDVAGQEKAVGSILAVTGGEGKPDGAPFIKMASGATVRKLSFWYPKQSFSAPLVYPPTLDCVNSGGCIEQVTLYNAYTGMRIGGENPIAVTVRGTCLGTGCWVAMVGNWPWFVGQHYNPVYWSRSGLPGAPAADSEMTQLRATLRAKFVGVLIKHDPREQTPNLDGMHFQDIRVDDAATGVEAHGGWFEFIGVSLRNVQCGWRCLGGGGLARMVGGEIQTLPGANTCGVYSGGGGARVYGIKFSGQPDTAVLVDSGTGRRDDIPVGIVDCTFEDWGKVAVNVAKGTVVVAGCDFRKDAPRDIVLNRATVKVAAIAGNRFAGKADIEYDSSAPGIEISHKPLDLPPLPTWALDYVLCTERKPARPEKFFPVAEFGAKSEGGTNDNTVAFQSALAAARQAGGGTVFVPGGWWRIGGSLTIPKGVELRGAREGTGVRDCLGTTLFPTAGKGQPDGSPFITMEPGSGLRGLIVFYPDVVYARNVKYPWTVRGTGAGIWVRDVRLANSWNGIDFGTQRCDDFDLVGVWGDARDTGIWISGGSNSGRVERTGWWWIGDSGQYPGTPKEWWTDESVSTRSPIRLGNTDSLTFLWPDCFKGQSALFTLEEDKGVTRNLRIIGGESDTVGFLYVRAAQSAELVGVGGYSPGITVDRGEITMHGAGTLGGVAVNGGRLNMYGGVSVPNVEVTGGAVSLLGVGGRVVVLRRQALASRISAATGLDVDVYTSASLETNCLADSHVQFLGPGVLDRCDTLVGWTRKVSLDDKEKKEGRYSIRAEENHAVWFEKQLEPMDHGVTETNGVLRLWLFVEDASKVGKTARLQLSSAGHPDRDAYVWSLAGALKQNGWNELGLRFGEAAKLGKPDIKRLNRFRICDEQGAPGVRRMDDVRVGGQ